MDTVGKFFSTLVSDYFMKDGNNHLTGSLFGVINGLNGKQLLAVLNKFTLEEYKEFMPILMNKFQCIKFVYLDMKIPHCLRIVNYDGKSYQYHKGELPSKNIPEVTWTDYDSYLETIRICCNDGEYYPNPKYLN